MFCKIGVLKNPAKFTENTCARASFLIKLQVPCRSVTFSKVQASGFNLQLY